MPKNGKFLLNGKLGERDIISIYFSLKLLIYGLAKSAVTFLFSHFLDSYIFHIYLIQHNKRFDNMFFIS